MDSRNKELTEYIKSNAKKLTTEKQKYEDQIQKLTQ